MNKRICIIGGGFSGVALLMQLSRMTTDTALEIFLCEKSAKLAQGPAYSTPYLYHLLNVDAGGMSALADKPNDFVEWLQQDKDSHIEHQYLSRLLFSRYVNERLTQVLQAQPKVKVHYIYEEVTAIKIENNHYRIQTQQGKDFLVDYAVLALGNPPPRDLMPKLITDKYIRNPWQYSTIANIDKTADVLIIGTGLTMVDAVLTLREHQHQGRIYALSRHGLLPQTHQLNLPKMDYTEIDAEQHLLTLTHKLRHHCQLLAEQETNWQVVFKALRCKTQLLWQHLSLIDKKRFLRHLQTYWDIHRHRIAPQIGQQIEQALAKNQLKLIAGHLMDYQQQGNKINIHYKPRHEDQQQSLSVDYVINCVGPYTNYQRIQQPLIQNLLQQGLVQTDPFNLGLAVDDDCRLLTKNGVSASKLYGIGPLTKGKFWEIIAVPDIRLQTSQLAELLIKAE